MHLLIFGENQYIYVYILEYQPANYSQTSLTINTRPFYVHKIQCQIIFNQIIKIIYIYKDHPCYFIIQMYRHLWPYISM